MVAILRDLTECDRFSRLRRWPWTMLNSDFLISQTQIDRDYRRIEAKFVERFPSVAKSLEFPPTTSHLIREIDELGADGPDLWVRVAEPALPSFRCGCRNRFTEHCAGHAGRPGALAVSRAKALSCWPLTGSSNLHISRTPGLSLKPFDVPIPLDVLTHQCAETPIFVGI
jgi:hypothetical protein